MVSLPRSWFIALVVGVCVLSAAIGSGLALLAQTGPSGARGARGPAGPRGAQGPEGPSGAAEVEGLEAEVGELRERVEEGSDNGEVEHRLEELESEVSELGGISSELCKETGVFAESGAAIKLAAWPVPPTPPTSTTSRPASRWRGGSTAIAPSASSTASGRC